MYRNTYVGELAPWKVELIVRRAWRMGFRTHDLDDVQQELVLVVAGFEFDPQAGATEKTALTALIDCRLKALRRAHVRYGRRLHRVREERMQAPATVGSEEHRLLTLDVRRATEGLSPEDQELCQALADGTSPDAVARQLGCGWHTIQRRMQRIRRHFRALGLHEWLSL